MQNKVMFAIAFPYLTRIFTTPPRNQLFQHTSMDFHEVVISIVPTLPQDYLEVVEEAVDDHL